MFRRLPNRLPPDISFPADLKELGYFINDEDQFRQIANPGQKYQYKLNRNERVNDMYKEAMNTCTRNEVMKRLHDLGMRELCLPLGTDPNDKHIPILVSSNIASKKHIIVYFGERHADLGILAYRVTGEESINTGSLVNFAKSVLQGPGSQQLSEDEQPGLIIANPAQLIWYRGGGRVVTDREWMYLPRQSAVHGGMRLDEDRNRVQGNKDYREHIHYIFQHVLSSSDTGLPLVCRSDSKVTIIGQEFPGTEALQHLVANWSKWQDRVSCVALVNPQHTIEQVVGVANLSGPEAVDKTSILNFIAQRTRAYRLDSSPLETVIHGRAELGSNVYSAGESMYEESCFVRCWPSVIDWVTLCRHSTTYQEKPLEPVEYVEGHDSDDQTRYRSPRKAQSDELAQETRFHGEMALASNVSETVAAQRLSP